MSDYQLCATNIQIMFLLFHYLVEHRRIYIVWTVIKVTVYIYM